MFNKTEFNTMENKHTHKSVVNLIFNKKVTPMLTVYHRSFLEAVNCEATKKYIERHHTAHGIYADCIQKTIEPA